MMNKVTNKQAAALAAAIEGKVFGESVTVREGEGLFVVIPVSLAGYESGNMKGNILNHTPKGGTLLKSGYQGYVNADNIPVGVWVQAAAGLNVEKYDNRAAIEAERQAKAAGKAAKNAAEKTAADMLATMKAAGIDANELIKMLSKAAKQA